jgi:hypothetical protein
MGFGFGRRNAPGGFGWMGVDLNYAATAGRAGCCALRHELRSFMGFGFGRRNAPGVLVDGVDLNYAATAGRAGCCALRHELRSFMGFGFGRRNAPGVFWWMGLI